jgi:hypothetical protein
VESSLYRRYRTDITIRYIHLERHVTSVSHVREEVSSQDQRPSISTYIVGRKSNPVWLLSISAAVMSFINKIGKIFGASSSAPVATASRSVAKERLSVILAAQRGTHLLEGVDMEKLQKDVMEVVQVRAMYSDFISMVIYSYAAIEFTRLPPPFSCFSRGISGLQRPARQASM